MVTTPPQLALTMETGVRNAFKVIGIGDTLAVPESSFDRDCIVVKLVSGYTGTAAPPHGTIRLKKLSFEECVKPSPVSGLTLYSAHWSDEYRLIEFWDGYAKMHKRLRAERDKSTDPFSISNLTAQYSDDGGESWSNPVNISASDLSLLFPRDDTGGQWTMLKCIAFWMGAGIMSSCWPHGKTR